MNNRYFGFFVLLFFLSFFSSCTIDYYFVKKSELLNKADETYEVKKSDAVVMVIEALYIDPESNRSLTRLNNMYVEAEEELAVGIVSILDANLEDSGGFGGPREKLGELEKLHALYAEKIKKRKTWKKIEEIESQWESVFDLFKQLEMLKDAYDRLSDKVKEKVTFVPRDFSVSYDEAKIMASRVFFNRGTSLSGTGANRDSYIEATEFFLAAAKYDPQNTRAFKEAKKCKLAATRSILIAAVDPAVTKAHLYRIANTICIQALLADPKYKEYTRCVYINPMNKVLNDEELDEYIESLAVPIDIILTFRIDELDFYDSNLSFEFDFKYDIYSGGIWFPNGPVSTDDNARDVRILASYSLFDRRNDKVLKKGDMKVIESWEAVWYMLAKEEASDYNSRETGRDPSLKSIDLLTVRAAHTLGLKMGDTIRKNVE